MQYQPLFTGLSDFDALAGPLPPGKVTAVAGISSVGSTAFALTVARHNLAEGHTVAFLNYQAPHDALIKNFLAAESATNVDRWDTLNEGRIRRLKRASQTLQDARLWTGTPAGSLWTPARIVQDLDEVEDLSLLIMDDYASACDKDVADDEMLQALQALAAERGAAVLATAHLRRGEYGEDRSVPSFGDLHGRDTVLSTVETAIVLHRPDLDGNVPERRGEIDVIAARGWQTTGTVTVRFEPEYHRLVDHPNKAAPRPGITARQ